MRKYLAIVLATAAFSIIVFSLVRGWQAYQKDSENIKKLAVTVWPITQVTEKSPARLAYRGKIEPPTIVSPLFDWIAPGQFNNTPEVRYRVSSGFEVVSDPLGLRVGSPREKLKTADILSVGGSHVWGQGLDYGELFSTIIARKMGYSSANAGAGGYGGAQSLLQLERYLFLQPKIILYGLYEDHMYRDIESGEKPNLKLHGQTYFLNLTNIATYGNRSIPELFKKIGINGVFANAFFYQARHDIALIGSNFGAASIERYNFGGRPVYGDPEMSPLMIDGMSFILRNMNEHAKSLGAKFIVVYLPTRRPNFGNAPVAWKKLSRSDGFKFIDTTQYIRSHSDEEIAIPNDGHYNATVNRYVSEKILKYLRPLP